MGVKYTRRGVLFGAEGNLTLRSDFAEVETTDGIVEFAGTPVAVVFGTRFVDPVVTGWDILSEFSSKFYLPDRADIGVHSQVITRKDANNNDVPDERQVRMTVLSMRWVLCLGRVDYGAITRLLWNGQVVPFREVGLPPAASGSDNARLRRIAQSWIDEGARRIVVNETAADLFGGRDAGGPGYPFARYPYSADTQLSEFWLMDTGGQPSIPNIDHDTGAKGVTSLFFNNFNFGGKRPIPKAKVAVSRNNFLTEIDKDGRFKLQWQAGLSTIGELPPPNSNPYYLIVLDSSLEKADREKVKEYLLWFPYDESGTQYQIIRAGYREGGRRIAPVVETVINEEGDRQQTKQNLLRDRLDKYIADSVSNSSYNRITNFDDEQAKVLVETYGNHMYSVLNRRGSRTGAILLVVTDLFAYPTSRPRTSATISLHFARQAALLMKYPNTITEARDFRNNVYPTENQLDGIQRFQPEIHMLVWSYYDVQTARYRGIRTREALTAPYFSDYDEGFRVWDDGGRLSIGGGGVYTTSLNHEFAEQYQIAKSFGFSQNPIHAVREALTNPDWGEAVPEDRINEADFYAAAVVCKRERLDYCYVHRQLGGVERMVTGITDFIDAILWYDAFTDSVRIKLIREDYDITDLPTFDESSIASIENYRRLNTNELTNSVTVKYHDAVLGANETVTVHDLEASFRAGGVKSSTFNYDGCATLSAAATVAERELVSLSRSVVTFTVKLHSGEHVLGLGDPVIISYRDLGLESAVMRVTRILYGDGTTGGISVDLVQDVFADLTLFGELIEVEPYLSVSAAPPFVRLSAEVVFLEQGWFDLTTVTAFDVNLQERWIKAGIRYNPDVDTSSYVSIDNVVQNVAIGTLLSDIPPLTSDPRSQSFWIEVRFNPEPTADNYIRIGDEIFRTGVVRQTSDDTFEIEIKARAERDTVATRGTINHGADVWFLDQLWIDDNVWDGSLIHALFQSGVHGDVELLDPNNDINFISRGNLPQPPAYLTVDGRFGSNAEIDGDITAEVLAREEHPQADQLETIVELKYGDTVLFTDRSTPTENLIGQTIANRVTIPTATISAGVPAGAGILQLSAWTIWQGRNSWQRWTVDIDWSATERIRCGWGADFGSNWGGQNCDGWGLDYGEGANWGYAL